jgi:uncharacterized membrane protein YfcA
MPNPLTCLEGVGAGVLSGFLAGLFGVGGGILLIPLLAILLHSSQHQAQGMSLAVMLLPIGLPAVLTYRKQGFPIHWRLVAVMIVGFLMGIVTGAKTANLIPDNLLRMCFSAFLVIVATRLLLKKPSSGTRTAEQHTLSWQRVALPGLLTGLAGGITSGLLGIGGAIIMIPLMTWLLELSQHEAQLASLTLLLPPLGLPGVMVYVKEQGTMPWTLLAFVVLGFLGGTYAGARLATRVRGSKLQKAFGCLLIGVALWMAAKAL